MGATFKQRKRTSMRRRILTFGPSCSQGYILHPLTMLTTG